MDPASTPSPSPAAQPAPNADPAVEVEAASPAGALPPSSARPPSASSAQPPSASVPPDPKRKLDRIIGLLIVAVSFAICLVLSIWAKEKSRPETSEPPGPPTISGIIGYPTNVDAVDTLPAARKLSKRPLLRGFVLDGVQSDGTINVTEGPGRVRYSFQSPAGHGPQPHREPGTLAKRVTCGRQNVMLRKEGLVAEPDLADYPCAGANAEPLPDPKCSARELWRLAKKRRVPRDRLARLEYFRSKAGPAWRFEIAGTPHSFTMYGDCKRELTGSDAQGTVP